MGFESAHNENKEWIFCRWRQYIEGYLDKISILANDSFLHANYIIIVAYM